MTICELNLQRKNTGYIYASISSEHFARCFLFCLLSYTINSMFGHSFYRIPVLGKVNKSLLRLSWHQCGSCLLVQVSSLVAEMLVFHSHQSEYKSVLFPKIRKKDSTNENFLKNVGNGNFPSLRTPSVESSCRLQFIFVYFTVVSNKLCTSLI